jgi:hypothetical protein
MEANIMRNTALKGTAGLFLAMVLSAPAWGAAISDHPGTAYPGTLNYVEGQVSIGSQAMDSKSIGTAELGAGQTMTTEQGKAEVLLTPGVFLRLGDGSEVKMIAPNLNDTEVAIQKGEATVEVTNIHPENQLIVDEGNTATRLEKRGFYGFDADQGIVRVFSGQAEVRENNRTVKVKGGHEVTLGSENLKAQGFDKSGHEGDLYGWSKLRSSYMAEANAQVAPLYEGYGPGWYGTGWYWDPWLSSYAFLPGGADIFYSPFGWGFYSPFAFYGAYPFGFGGYGYYGRGFHEGRAGVGRDGHGFNGGGVHAGGGGVHAGGGGAHVGGSGFSGGGGGFHGGGGGGFGGGHR